MKGTDKTKVRKKLQSNRQKYGARREIRLKNDPVGGGREESVLQSSGFKEKDSMKGGERVEKTKQINGEE